MKQNRRGETEGAASEINIWRCTAYTGFASQESCA